MNLIRNALPPSVFSVSSSAFVPFSWPGNPPNSPPLQEQFGYACDQAWNLNQRTNNAMVETFNVNNVTELTSFSRSGTLTVAGMATEWSANVAYPGVTNVTVNGQSAEGGLAELRCGLNFRISRLLDGMHHS